MRGTGIRQQLNWMDAPGILLFAAGLTTLLIGVLSAKSAGGISAGHLILAGVGLLLLTAFVWHELRAASPFIPLRTFVRYPVMTQVNVEYILVNLLYYSLFFGLPSYLQQVRDISEFHTGLLMLSLGLCSLAASPLAGRWIDKSGPRVALFVSALLMTFGSLLLTMQTAGSSLLGIGIALAAFGISNGLNSVEMQAALFQSAPKEIIGVASGIFNTSRYFGTILSSLLISIVMGNSFSAGGLRILAVVLTAVSLSLVVMNRGARNRLNQ
ncbi:Multidrug resistance protein stp [compost metagenome]